MPDLANSEDSDQTGRMPRLIWAFAGRKVILLVLSRGSSFVRKMNKSSSLEKLSHVVPTTRWPVKYPALSRQCRWHYVTCRLVTVVIITVMKHTETRKQTQNMLLKICVASQFEQQHDKTNKITVRPAKTQISLGIRPVWSASSLYAQWVAKVSSCGQRRLWSDWANAQAESSLGAHAILLVLSRGGSNMLFKIW